MLVLGELLDLVAAHEDLLGARDAVFGVLGVPYPLGDLAARGERVDGAEGAGEGEGRERVVLAGSWVDVSGCVGLEDATEGAVHTGFVDGLVRGLRRVSGGWHQLGERSVCVVVEQRIVQCQEATLRREDTRLGRRVQKGEEKNAPNSS